MKKDSTTTLLLIAGAAGLYFLVTMNRKEPAGMSQTDVAMMQQLAQMQTAAAMQQDAMIRIIQDAKASSNSSEAMNPWIHPNTVMKMASLGIQLGSLFV